MYHPKLILKHMACNSSIKDENCKIKYALNTSDLTQTISRTAQLRQGKRTNQFYGCPSSQNQIHHPN